jgi:integrase/recombinase XerD
MAGKIKFQIPQTLPRTIPLAAIENVLRTLYHELKQTKTTYALNTSLRNTAIIELLFTTGLRVSELCSLNAQHIDFGNGSIRIMGKGAKERILQYYRLETRKFLRFYDVIPKKTRAYIHKIGYFFLTDCRRAFPNSLSVS